MDHNGVPLDADGNGWDFESDGNEWERARGTLDQASTATGHLSDADVPGPKRTARGYRVIVERLERIVSDLKALEGEAK